MRADRSRTLAAARNWYVLVGVGALLLWATDTYGAIGGGSRFDVPIVAAGSPSASSPWGRPPD